MAGIRGALLVLLLVAGGTSGQMAQEVSEAGKRTLEIFSGDRQVHLRITVRMYNFGVARSTLTSAEGKATVILNQAGLEVAWVLGRIGLSELRAFFP